MEKKKVYEEINSMIKAERTDNVRYAKKLGIYEHKLGSLEPCATTDLYSPEGDPRIIMQKVTNQRGIIDIIMKKKDMKSWHDGV